VLFSGRPHRRPGEWCRSRFVPCCPGRTSRRPQPSHRPAPGARPQSASSPPRAARAPPASPPRGAPSRSRNKGANAVVRQGCQDYRCYDGSARLRRCPPRRWSRTAVSGYPHSAGTVIDDVAQAGAAEAIEARSISDEAIAVPVVAVRAPPELVAIHRAAAGVGVELSDEIIGQRPRDAGISLVAAEVVAIPSGPGPFWVPTQRKAFTIFGQRRRRGGVSEARCRRARYSKNRVRQCIPTPGVGRMDLGETLPPKARRRRPSSGSPGASQRVSLNARIGWITVAPILLPANRTPIADTYKMCPASRRHNATHRVSPFFQAQQPAAAR